MPSTPDSLSSDDCDAASTGLQFATRQSPTTASNVGNATTDMEMARLYAHVQVSASVY